MPSHPTLHTASLALPLLLLGFSANAFLRPDAHLTSLGFPLYTPSQNPEAAGLNLALMRIWGVRNFAVGSILVLIWRTGDEKLMAKATAVGGVLAVVDGWVSRGLGSGVLMHWGLVPVVWGVAAGLGGWFD